MPVIVMCVVLLWMRCLFLPSVSTLLASSPGCRSCSSTGWQRRIKMVNRLLKYMTLYDIVYTQVFTQLLHCILYKADWKSRIISICFRRGGKCLASTKIPRGQPSICKGEAPSPNRPRWFLIKLKFTGTTGIHVHVHCRMYVVVEM